MLDFSLSWRCNGSRNWRGLPTKRPVSGWKMSGVCLATRLQKPTTGGELIIKLMYSLALFAQNESRWSQAQVRNLGLFANVETWTNGAITWAKVSHSLTVDNVRRGAAFWCGNPSNVGGKCQPAQRNAHLQVSHGRESNGRWVLLIGRD